MPYVIPFMRATHEMLNIAITKMGLKVTLLILQTYSIRAKELPSSL